jgi:hypothetical protein
MLLSGVAAALSQKEKEIQLLYLPLEIFLALDGPINALFGHNLIGKTWGNLLRQILIFDSHDDQAHLHRSHGLLTYFTDLPWNI